MNDYPVFFLLLVPELQLLFNMTEYGYFQWPAAVNIFNDLSRFLFRRFQHIF